MDRPRGWAVPIFTFAAERTVAHDFPGRVAALVKAVFGKLRSVELLREPRAGFAACTAAMPVAAITIDTGTTMPDVAAAQIAQAVVRQRR